MNESERAPLSSDLLRRFPVITECGNLTEAAGRLFRRQSAISVQQRKLEEVLGTSLLHRTAKGRVLSEAGICLRPRAQAILADLQEAGVLFKDPLTGSIRVGFPAAIRDRDLDIAVCSGPDNASGETLEVDKPVWVVKAGKLISAEAPVPLALRDRRCWWRDLPTRALDATGRSYAIAFRSGSFTSLQAAVRAGVAVGILPANCVDDTMQTLGAAGGFPDLPRSRRSILVNRQASAALTGAMAAAIREAVRKSKA